jgi:hypothetical protein
VFELCGILGDEVMVRATFRRSKQNSLVRQSALITEAGGQRRPAGDEEAIAIWREARTTRPKIRSSS